MMDRFETWATRLWRAACGGLLLTVTLITLAQVTSRYFINATITWSEELNRLLYVWVIMLGAVGADHMRIGLLADRPQYRRVLGIVAALCGAVALALIVWGGWRLQAAFAMDRYTTLDLSKAWYFAAAIVGGALWAGADIWRALRRNRRKDDDPAAITDAET